MASMNDSLERSWRLLPSERVLWHGTPTAGVPRDRRWFLLPAFTFSLAAVTLCFAALLWVTGIGASRQSLVLACYLCVTGLAGLLAPRYLLDRCEYLVTDKRVLWRRGMLRRSMDRASITFARICWHGSVVGVGHLELLRAVPFGPLARRQRLIFHDVRGPDLLWALIRGVGAGEHAGASDVRLAERLDPGERVMWGAGPDGWSIGWREALIALLGVAVLAVGLRYGHEVAGILLGLEDLGLRVRSWTWLFLFLATGLSWVVIITTGLGLLWWGTLRARALSLDTEYVLTDKRLLIRRGRTELSVDRRRIVDVADAPGSRGARNLFLILDAPQARALADSGALARVTPARDAVPPVLYDLRDPEGVRELILGRTSRPPLRDAA